MLPTREEAKEAIDRFKKLLDYQDVRREHLWAASHTALSILNAYSSSTLIEARTEEEIEKCIWSQEDEDSDCYSTSCGNAFVLNDGTPKENSIKFCFNCGKPVEEDLYKRQPED
jgi:hypothetical protein